MWPRFAKNACGHIALQGDHGDVCFANIKLLPLRGVRPLNERAAWFRHDRFGLFIHFGVFSEIGKGEWIRESGQIPLAEYNKLLPKFNPSQFNAAEWVVYDALYAYCCEMVRRGRMNGAFKR